jgi:glycosyltransferase involved in cell wall biosynthesis
VLRIGVNALYLIPGGVGGTEVYLRSLLPSLAEIDRINQYFIFTNAETGTDLVPQSSNFEQVKVDVRATFRPGRILAEQFVLPFLQKTDVMLNPGFTAPIAHPNNVTVFHDLQHKRHPEYFRWFDLPFWNLLLWASAHRSKKLISVSQATADDLRRFYGFPSTVIPHGVDPLFFEIAQERHPEDFLLCVSTLHPHKNIDRLLRAFAKLKQTDPKIKLVLAGMKGFFAAQIESEIARLNLQHSVRVTGWIAQAELLELYRRARAIVYPSTFEGFGMPVLEALAAEVPLACSDIEPLRSLASPEAIFFDPQSEDSIAAGLLQLLHAEAKPNQRIRQFTWRRTAELTLNVLNR